MSPGLASSTTALSAAAPGGSARSRLRRLPVTVLVGVIRVYQQTLSPLLPIVTLGRCACRFAPTCSHYAVEALQLHGPARGLWLAALRLARCNPLNPGGIDPVPPRRPPQCTRVDPFSP